MSDKLYAISSLPPLSSQQNCLNSSPLSVIHQGNVKLWQSPVLWRPANAVDQPCGNIILKELLDLKDGRHKLEESWGWEDALIVHYTWV